MLKLTKSTILRSQKLPFFNFNQSQYLFCTNNNPPPTKKLYTIPEKQIPQLHIIPRKIHFKNGRYLLYLNKQNLTTPYLLDLHYLIPMTYFGYLIANNPFYLTFPAALPILFMVQATYLLRYVEHRSHHKQQIERIYFLESGNQIQLVFANRIRRYLKSNKQYLISPIQQFLPKYDKQIATGNVKTYRGLRFPNPDTKLFQAKKPTMLQYGWTFRNISFDNFVLPAQFQYADWDLLTKVLNGVYIVSEGYTYEGNFKPNNYPSIEEQLKNVEKIKNQKSQQTPKQEINNKNVKVENLSEK